MLNALFAAPASDWIRFTTFLGGIVLFIALAEAARIRLGWPAEVNRKLVHIGTGFLIFFCAFLFESPVPLAWMAVLFIGINFMGIKTGRLKGMHGTERPTYGTVFYPLSFLILVLTCWRGHRIFLITGMLVLAVADAAAAIVGESLRHPHGFTWGKDRKSVEGSLTMFGVTLALLFFVLPRIAHLDNLTFPWWRALWIGLVVAPVVTVSEALSVGGSDNLTVPLGTALMLFFTVGQTIEQNLQVTAGLLLAGVVAFGSVRARFLTPGGGAAAFLLGTLLFGTGGWAWTAPILVFFFSSSLLSKMGKAKKIPLALLYEKGARRDAGQVLANGGIPASMVIAYRFDPSPIWYALYLAAVSAVNADTWATELGVYSRLKPRSIRTFRPVPHGTSGGITPLGTAAALLGSGLVTWIGSLVAPARFGIHPSAPLFWIITASGFGAALVDSLLGATLQAQYRCVHCGKDTEKATHCGSQAHQIGGLSWIRNDTVNALCAASAALFTWCLMAYVR